MALYFETPHSSLQQFVNAYILYEDRQPAPSPNILPLGTQFIWILLEGELMIKSRKKGDLRIPRIVMLGFFTQPFKHRKRFPQKLWL